MTAPSAAPAPLEVSGQAPDRNLALELVRVTEAAAMAAGRWVGRGDKNGADRAAVNAMRQLIGTVSMNGVVVIGEGEKDDAPMLYNGERVGSGTGPDCDVAVDPIDGTRLTALGMTNAIAVMAVSERGSMYDPSAVFYMEKLVTGPDAADAVDLTAPVADNIRAVARAKRESADDVTVVILDRPRHESLVEQIRATGARIKFITDGDVAGAIMAIREGTGIDLLVGIGGTPEGVITAAAVKCLGGVIQGRLWPRDDEEREKAMAAGHDLRSSPDDRRPAARGRRLLRRHRHHRRRASPGCALPRRWSKHTLTRDALSQRHHSPHRERAQADASCARTAPSTSSTRAKEGLGDVRRCGRGAGRCRQRFGVPRRQSGERRARARAPRTPGPPVDATRTRCVRRARPQPLAEFGRDRACRQHRRCPHVDGRGDPGRAR